MSDKYQEAYEQALLGEFEGAERCLASPPPGDGGTADAWHATLAALHWMAAPEIGAPPDERSLVALTSPPARTVGAKAAAQRALASFLSFNADETSRWAALVSELEGGEAGVLSAFAEGLLAVVRGEGLRDAAGRFAERAQKAQEAPAVVDAASLQALAALADGDLEEATSRARRASRMARTESLLQQEYFANLVLARVRRHAGAPHLSARILTQLGGVLPGAWRGWLRWELALAGTAVDDGVGPVVGLAELRRAASAGDRVAFSHARDALFEVVAGCALLEAEARAVASSLDPASEPSAGARAFARGEVTASPFGVVDPGEGAAPFGWVLLQPDGACRRILAAGAPLLEGAWRPTEAQLQEKRSLALLSVLALGGPEGLESEVAFEAVYGFPFTSAKHDAVLRTLLHRTRTLLGDVGTLDREGFHLRLSVSQPIAVPDPRCARPAEQRVLALLAESGVQRSAKEVQQELKVPLRTVQLALQRLVDQGACLAQRVGRRIEYVVEDSTFYEPSLTRLRRAPAGARRRQ